MLNNSYDFDPVMAFWVVFILGIGIASIYYGNKFMNQQKRLIEEQAAAKTVYNYEHPEEVEKSGRREFVEKPLFQETPSNPPQNYSNPNNRAVNVPKSVYTKYNYNNVRPNIIVSPPIIYDEVVYVDTPVYEVSGGFAPVVEQSYVQDAIYDNSSYCTSCSCSCSGGYCSGCSCSY